jgi:two-component system, OmpR family, phosphate regulon sensor histidine kinase PhoR
MKRSVFLKIFSGYLLIACLLGGFLLYVSVQTLKKEYIAILSADLENVGRMLIAGLAPYLQDGSYGSLNVFVKQTAADLQMRITVVDGQGTVLADSEMDPAVMENHKARSEIIQALFGRASSSVRFSTTLDTSMLYVALPVYRDNTVAYVVRLSLSLSRIRTVLRDLRVGILQAVALGLVLALIVSAVLARRFSIPVRKLREASRRVAAGDFNARVFLKGQDELQELGESFNAMTDKIRSLFEEMAFQKEELNNIIASMHEGLLVIDRDDKIMLFNASLKKLAAREPREGMFYWETLREPQFGKIVGRVRSGRRDVVEEVFIGEKTFVCSASHIGPKNEIVLVLLDVSDIKNVERMKKDFVVNVSHELRTPLTAIKGFVETMLIEEVSESGHRHYLDIIKRHTDRLINIVKDLMTLASIERAGGLEKEPVSLRGLIDQTRKIYAQRLEEKKLYLTVTSETEQRSISADPFKLEQMFINLIDNAIKYTEVGGITITLAFEAGCVRIRVEDTGIGMEQQHLSKIFERFYVVDKSRARILGGTGLGLSIVKHIVLLHNGAISVTSRPGSGTAFTITLPMDG